MYRQTMAGFPRRIQRGFALVITLMLMILLTLLAVGLLSLSSIALRASAQAEAIGTARANARLALQLALGELQAQAGTDTRVTARADILEKKIRRSSVSGKAGMAPTTKPAGLLPDGRNRPVTTTAPSNNRALSRG